MKLNSENKTSTMRAIIVDDEVKNRRTLQMMCDEYCDDISIIGEAASVDEAKEVIDELKPDLVFLDIQMPMKNGFFLLEYYGANQLPFDVIFTTAHDQYAVKAFKFSASDYLMKPIDIDDLIASVEKVKTKKEKQQSKNKETILWSNIFATEIQKIALPTSEGFLFVPFSSIIYCKAEGNYTQFITVDKGNILITKTLKHYETVLEEQDFFRVHKSYLVNLQHVRKFIRGKKGMVEMSDNTTFEVSPMKKEMLLQQLALL